LTFSSLPKIIAIRTIQVLMPLFTFALSFGTNHDPVFEVIWYTALSAVEWFGFNIVQASLDVNGLNYHRFTGVKHVPWDKIRSATLWRSAGGLIVRLEGRGILRRYKFLFDSQPGIELVADRTAREDPIEIARLRQKLVGSIL